MSTDSPTVALPPVSPPAPARMTYEEFLAWAPEDRMAEWVNGEAILMPPPSLRHQDVIAFLSTLLRLFVESRDAGKVYFAPVQMRLKVSGREPDILFVATEHQSRFRDLYLDGPADLVVEVVSPESRSRDRVEKLREYQQAGIREYWLIDPIRQEAVFYTLGEDGTYYPIAVGVDGVFRSKVLTGFWLRVDWLWQDQFPRVTDVLKAWEAAD
jgi:Uma2 family endonuclease